jgi:hypothetical protein
MQLDSQVVYVTPKLTDRGTIGGRTRESLALLPLCEELQRDMQREMFGA